MDFLPEYYLGVLQDQIGMLVMWHCEHSTIS